MIAALKNTEFGHKVHRLLRGPLFTGILGIVVRAARVEFIQISHLFPKHLRHNADQKDILSKFENQQK